MENATGGELSDYIESKGKLSEEESLQYFRQLVSAVKYMHSVGIAHRDIKPANMMLDERMNLKLIDFGLGNMYSGKELLETPCGSPCYAAPELISGKQYNPEILDVWSCGVSLYNMIYGVLPFDDRSKDTLYQSIMKCKYPLPSGPTQGCIRMIRKIFVSDPEKRISLSEIMNDPWFLGKGKDSSTRPYIPSDHEPIIGSYFSYIDHKIAILTCAKIPPLTKSELEKIILKRKKNRITLTYYLFIQKSERNQLSSEELEIIDKEVNRENGIKPGVTLQSTAGCISIGKQSSPNSPTKRSRKIVKSNAYRNIEQSAETNELPALVSKKATHNPLRKMKVVKQDSNPLQENRPFDNQSPMFQS